MNVPSFPSSNLFLTTWNKVAYIGAGMDTLKKLGHRVESNNGSPKRLPPERKLAAEVAFPGPL
jgi:hypothetical protein